MNKLDPFNPEEFLILVVDDIRKNLQLLIEILDTSGYGTTFALSGKQALERIKVTEPDLILLDLMMPEMNGLEVCKRLKENPKTEKIPIIFLTAATETHYLVKAFELGAVDYVTKPFRTPELLARVKTHLDLKRTKDQLETAYQQMKRIAATDELTGIPNRRSIFEFGKQEFQRGQRYKDEYTFSVLMIDIDKFKTINDTYGHDVGDEAIKMMVKITLNCIRKVDHIGRLETEKEALKKKEALQRSTPTTEKEVPTKEGHLGRLGGEEFVVILPHTDLKGAKIAAQRVCEAMTQESLQVEDKTVTITVSIGVATYEPQDKKIDDILKRADTALFAAKANGRNRVATMENQKLTLSK